MSPDRALLTVLLLGSCTEGEPAVARSPLVDLQDPPLPDDHPTPPIDEEAPSWFGEAPLEPAAGTYFGVSLDYAWDSPAAYNERLGHRAADYVRFVDFPMSPDDEDRMDTFLLEVAEQEGIALMTFEPQVPLEEITPQMAEDLAHFLAHYNTQYELGILVRFAHEMNGSWYSWGQQPSEYIRVFRLVADAIHREASRTAMLWAPNYGGGYPFPGGAWLARPGTAAFPLLDTNEDGVLTEEDDTYTPYYPGDAYVDWVGMSLYHWGSRWPWGENELPEPHKFIDELTGTYDGHAGDRRAITDFYEAFSEQRGKPLAIVETGAFYSASRGGADALHIKRRWWNQVFSPEVFERFPRLRMINWFELDLRSPEAGGEHIDWTVTLDPTIREAFVADLPVERLIFAPVPVYEP